MQTDWLTITYFHLTNLGLFLQKVWSPFVNEDKKRKEVQRKWKTIFGSVLVKNSKEAKRDSGYFYISWDKEKHELEAFISNTSGVQGDRR